MSKQLDHRLQQLVHEQVAAAPSPHEWETVLDLANQTATIRPARRWPVAAAAGLLIVVGVVVVAMVRTTDTPAPATDTAVTAPTSTTQPEPPASTVIPGPSAATPLFVLPVEAAAAAISNASAFVADDNAVGLVVAETLVAVDNDGTFTNLAALRAMKQDPTAFGDWTQADIDGEVVFTTSQGPTAFAARQSGDIWITVESRQGINRSAALLTQTSIDATGQVVLSGAVADVTTVASWVQPAAATKLAVTSFEVNAATPSALRVETANVTSPIVPSVRVVDSLTRIDVDGIAGWLLRSSDDAGEWVGVFWSQTPDHIVAVSGVVTVEQALALAEQLQVVDEATWTATTGATTGGQATTPNVAPTTTNAPTTNAPLTAREDCAAPLPPPALIDGASPGKETNGPDNSVTWGIGDNSVTEYVGADIDGDLLELAEVSGNLRTAGDLTIAVVPIGDGSTGVIQIILLDTLTGCERQYFVGPGVEVDVALDFAQAFVEQLQ